MEIFKLIEKIIRDQGITVTEFTRRVDVEKSTYYKWRDGTNNPGPGTLRRIEKEFNVIFDRGKDGEIKGVLSDGAPLRSIRSREIDDHHMPESVRTTDTPLAGSAVIPRSVRDEYENYEFVGGKPDWLDLPDSERSYFEGLYQRMELEIDEANAERDRRVDRAVNEMRKLVRDRMLGIR